MTASMTMTLRLEHDWAGEPVGHVHAELTLSASTAGLRLEAWARRFEGAPVPHPPGRAPRLWEHEVLELFLLGDDAHYTELEFGPHGHWLGLRLEGERHCVDDALVLAPKISAVSSSRWSLRCELPWSLLPPGCGRLNAHAIVGLPGARQYLSWRGTPERREAGQGPDFHRLEAMGEIDESLRAHIARHQANPPRARGVTE